MKFQPYMIYLCLLVAGSWLPAKGQTVSYDPDASFEHARSLAFSGKTGPARDTLRRILGDFPEYTDVETLLASTYSWEGDYDKARRHLNRITSRDRQHEASWLAAIRNEQAAGNRSIALGIANKALMFLDSSEAIRRIRTELLADDKREQPVGSETEWRNYAGIENRLEAFDKAYDPMVYATLEYQRHTDYGRVIPRINYSNRFNTSGVQYEIDLYPRISGSFYGYLNYGFSDAPTYPQHRVGAELYANLPRALESSLGVRYLDFRESTALLFTGSFGLYRGNYYLSARPMVSVFKDRDPGFSGNILARRYFRDAANYLGIRAVYGFNPELQQLWSGTQLLAESLFFVESQQIQVEYQFSGPDQRNRYRAQIGLTRQELVLDPGSFFLAFQAGLRYHVGF